MLGRRGSPFGVQLFCVAIVLVMFVYGIYLYKTVSHQLDNVEKDNHELIIEKEGLSRDVHVLRETKSKLEQLLKDKQNECTANEERIGKELDKIRSDLNMEKNTHEDKVSSWNKERLDFQQHLKDVEEEKSKLRSDLDDIEGKMNLMREENYDLKKTKQESLNEAAKLSDELADLKRKVKELNKFKELYEAQNPKSNETRKEEIPKKEVKEEQMQIVEPAKNKAYYEPKSSKPEEHLRQQLNKTVEGQVTPPILQKDDTENKVHPDESLRKKDFKPDIPDLVIPKRAEIDVGGDHQVEKPELKVPVDSQLDKKEKIPREQGDIDQDLNEHQFDGENEANPLVQGEDDEDVPHRGLIGNRGAPQVMKVPQVADNDIELHQRRHGEP